MAHFEPCPKCGSRDNVRVYDDGHKWCFGCRYYVPSPDSIKNINNRIYNNYNNALDKYNLDTTHFTSTLPDLPRKWLTKYGISQGEIDHYKLQWNPAHNALVFPIYHETELVFVNERYFGPDPLAPKYRAYGPKDKHFLVIANQNTPRSCILVEDAVSAIKVGRFATAMPLWGSTLSTDGVKWLSSRFKAIRVWLDMDKASESLGFASRLSQTIPDVRTILTELDPKEYSSTQIINFLKGYGVLSSRADER